MTAVCKIIFTEKGAIQNLLYSTGLIICWQMEVGTALPKDLKRLLPQQLEVVFFSPTSNLIFQNLPISNCSLHATEEVLPTHCPLFCILTHPCPFSGILFCPEHREVSGDKPQHEYLALPTHLTVAHCIFFSAYSFLDAALATLYQAAMRSCPEEKSSFSSSFLFHNCSFPFSDHGFFILLTAYFPLALWRGKYQSLK